MRLARRGLLLVSAVAVLSVAACRDRPATDSRADSARPVMAVTIFPIGDIARTLAENSAD